MKGSWDLSVLSLAVSCKFRIFFSNKKFEKGFLPGGPIVKILSSTTEDMSSTPCQGTNVRHAMSIAKNLSQKNFGKNTLFQFSLPWSFSRWTVTFSSLEKFSYLKLKPTCSLMASEALVSHTCFHTALPVSLIFRRVWQPYPHGLDSSERWKVF